MLHAVEHFYWKDYPYFPALWKLCACVLACCLELSSWKDFYFLAAGKQGPVGPCWGASQASRLSWLQCRRYWNDDWLFLMLRVHVQFKCLCACVVQVPLKGQCHEIQWFFARVKNGDCSRKCRGHQTISARSAVRTASPPSWVEKMSFSSRKCRFPRPSLVTAIIFPDTKWLTEIPDYRDTAALKFEDILPSHFTVLPIVFLW